MLRLTALVLLVFFGGEVVSAGEGEEQSVIWSSCAIPALNVTSNAGFFGDGGFAYLQTCTSLRDLSRSTPYGFPSTTRPSCFLPLDAQRASAFANSSSPVADCNGAAQAIADAVFCAAGAGVLAASVASAINFAALVNATTCATADGTANLRNALAFAASALVQPTVQFRCAGNKIYTEPCDASLRRSFALPTFQSDVCDSTRGLSIKCTACQPFFDSSVTTQPYLFLIFPGLKLLIVKVLELSVFFKIAERLRQTIEEDLRQQETPKDGKTHPPEFVGYVNKVLLLDGQRRIRQRLTSRRRDGKDNVVKLLDKFKDLEKKNGGHIPEPLPLLSEDEYKELVHEQGIALQAASFKKKDCTQPCVDALAACGITANETDEDVRDNEVIDWYYNEICAYGSRQLRLQGDVWERLVECVRVQLDLMAKRAALPLAGPRLTEPASVKNASVAVGDRRHEPIYEDNTTIDNGRVFRDNTDTIVTADDRTGSIIAIDGEKVDENDQPEPVTDLIEDVALTFTTAETAATKVEDCHRHHRHRVKHRHQRSRERLNATFLADVHDTPSPADGHVVEVALRSTVLRSNQDVEEHLVVCNDTVSLLRVADTVAHAIAKQKTVHQSVEHVRVKLYHAGSDVTQPLDLTLHVNDVIKADASRLCLRYRVEVVSDEAFALLRAQTDNSSMFDHLVDEEYAHCLEAYDAYDAQIDRLREEFEASIATEPATFEREWLVADTDKNLSRILDGRVTTIAKEFVLSLCGDEVIYECDVTTEERYELRDAIAPLTSDLAATAEFIAKHSIDPLVTYHRCYDYLTVYKTWNGETRHGVLRAFLSERPKVLELLESLYTTIRDRLQVEKRAELDEVACRALALHFKHNLDDVSRIVPVVLIGEQVVKSIFAVNTYLLIVAVLYAVAIFIVSCVDGTRSGSTTGWTAYEEIYFRFLNTGTAATIFCGSLTNWTMNAEQRFQSKFFAVIDRVLLLVSIVLILPPLATHILPGFATYCWVILGTTFILSIPVLIMRRGYMHLEQKSRDEFEDMTEHERLHRRRRLKWYLVILFLLVSFVATVFITGFLQSSYNWAYLLYRHAQYNLNYITVLQFEANGRTLQCYWERALESPYMNLQWISSFI